MKVHSSTDQTDGLTLIPLAFYNGNKTRQKKSLIHESPQSGVIHHSISKLISSRGDLGFECLFYHSTGITSRHEV